jgi:hypothetical protein
MTHRWELFQAFGGRQDPFDDMAELNRIFENS